MNGIDISENNGVVNWQLVKEAGIDFAIIRLGYGKGHLDSMFYANVNGALGVGLKIGVYYYDYGLDVETAEIEAQFVIDTLAQAGLTDEQLPIGVWFDMEDADDWKGRHGMPDNQTITAMCSAFISTLNAAGYHCGIYASLDWLETKIDRLLLADYVPYWNAQWGSSDDIGAKIWQYTDRLLIDGMQFDGDIYYDN